MKDKFIGIRCSLSLAVLFLRQILSALFLTVFALTGGIVALLGWVGIIWLLFLQKWGTLVFSGIGFVLGYPVVSVAITVSLGLVAVAAIPFKNKFFLSCIGVICLGIGLGLIALWDNFVFHFLVNISRPHAYLPTLLIASAVATGPTASAGFDAVRAGDEGKGISILFSHANCIACLVLIISALFFQLSFLASFYVLAVSLFLFMSLGLLAKHQIPDLRKW
jgi:hypothetical protein